MNASIPRSPAMVSDLLDPDCPGLEKEGHIRTSPSHVPERAGVWITPTMDDNNSSDKR